MPLPDVLEQMLTTGYTLDSEGNRVAVHSQIGREFSEAIGRVVGDRKPALSIEVGMAFGFSTLAMLSGGGEVVSIDPYQLDPDEYDRLGVHAVERTGFSDRHRLIPEPSHVALPQLLSEGTRAQFAYIDGAHTFDYTLIDFFYIDKLLDVGGVVAFNDCYLPAVNRVIRYVLTHRQYREIDAGLPKSYPHQRNPAKALALRLRRHQAQDRYFKKVGDSEPRWDFYQRF